MCVLRFLIKATRKASSTIVLTLPENLWAGTRSSALAPRSDGKLTLIAEILANNPDYRIAVAKTREELAKALEIIEWTADHALPSGVLAEQMNPLTGEPVSVSPLTWSHSTFVATVMNYLRANKSLSS